MKALYDRSKLFRWTVAILFATALMALLVAAMFGTVGLLGLRVDNPAHLVFAQGLAVVLFLPIWMMIAGFLVAPLLRVVGHLKYYSPLLIVTRSSGSRLDLHGAMLFDYVLLFRWCDRGRPAVRKTMLWYIDGLIALARDIERGRYPADITLSGTSYFFSESSAKRHGFRVEKGSRFAFGGFLTYPTQFLTYSFAKGRWAFPPILKAKNATIDGATLCTRIPRLERVRKHLHDAQVQYVSERPG